MQRVLGLCMATSLKALRLPPPCDFLQLRFSVMEGRRLGFRYAVGGRGMGVRFTR